MTDGASNRIKVMKGVPMPHSRGAGEKYPWRDMEVGDCFDFPPVIKRNHAGTAATIAGKRTGRKFATRKLPDGTIRCWRVA